MFLYYAFRIVVISSSRFWFWLTNWSISTQVSLSGAQFDAPVNANNLIDSRFHASAPDNVNSREDQTPQNACTSAPEGQKLARPQPRRSVLESTRPQLLEVSTQVSLTFWTPAWPSTTLAMWNFYRRWEGYATWWRRPILWIYQETSESWGSRATFHWIFFDHSTPLLRPIAKQWKFSQLWQRTTHHNRPVLTRLSGKMGKNTLSAMVLLCRFLYAVPKNGASVIPRRGFLLNRIYVVLTWIMWLIRHRLKHPTLRNMRIIATACVLQGPRWRIPRMVRLSPSGMKNLSTLQAVKTDQLTAARVITVTLLPVEKVIGWSILQKNNNSKECFPEARSYTAGILVHERRPRLVILISIMVRSRSPNSWNVGRSGPNGSPVSLKR